MRESQKLSALLFFQFIYTNVGLNKYVIFLHSLFPFRCTWSSGSQACVFPPGRRLSVGRATIYAPLPALLCNLVIIIIIYLFIYLFIYLAKLCFNLRLKSHLCRMFCFIFCVRLFLCNLCFLFCARFLIGHCAVKKEL